MTDTVGLAVSRLLPGKIIVIFICFPHYIESHDLFLCNLLKIPKQNQKECPAYCVTYRRIEAMLAYISILIKISKCNHNNTKFIAGCQIMGKQPNSYKGRLKT